MPFSKKNNEDFSIINNRIVLSEHYLQKNKFSFKKITGTRLSAILCQSEYNSPVKTWAQMVNIYYESLDPMYANAGNIIEPKIRDYVCQATNIEYISHDPASCKWDVFKDNPIFGGIPDGEPVNERHELCYPEAPILEIKTSSIDAFKFKKEHGLFVLVKDEHQQPVVKTAGEKRKKWFNSQQEIIIPTEYQYQLGLYCYLRNAPKGLFAVCFLETADYVHPELTNIDQREIYLVDFTVDLEEFKKVLAQAEEWYNEYVKKGISPELTKEDLEWINEQLKVS